MNRPKRVVGRVLIGLWWLGAIVAGPVAVVVASSDARTAFATVALATPAGPGGDFGAGTDPDG